MQTLRTSEETACGAFTSVLLSLIAILLFSRTVFAIRISLPPFDGIYSLLSLPKNPSLVPPYNLQSDPNADDKSRTQNSAIVSGADVVHFCFLLHGYQGISGDLSYLEAMMDHRACNEKNQQRHRHKEKLPPENCDVDDDFVIIPADISSNNASSRIQDMVVHNCKCNEGRTTDGIINGGERLIHEIRTVIDSNMKQRQKIVKGVENSSDRENLDSSKQNEDPCNQTKNSEDKLHDITISILGNSMGGLYGRYAIAKLIEHHSVLEIESSKNNQEQKKHPTCWILDGKYRLSLNTFCTTAAPHLGVSQHTWIRIPRIAEMAVAFFMGETGSDLFRWNSLLYTMATDSVFLDSLASFRRRIAYANCYGTDFPVPMETAAFLSETSTHPHQIYQTCRIRDGCDLVVATLRTKRVKPNKAEGESFDELHQMSVSLDSLGWKKAFVDLRREMISIEVSRPSWIKWIQLSNRRTKAREDTNTSASERSKGDTPLFDSTKHKLIGSKTIIHTFANHALEKNNHPIFCLPFGHNMIVAFARNHYSAFFNKGGRPLVDMLTKELVRDIFAMDERNAPLED